MLKPEEQKKLVQLIAKFTKVPDASMGALAAINKGTILSSVQTMATLAPNPDIRLRALKIMADLIDAHEGEYFRADPAVAHELLSVDYNMAVPLLLQLYVTGIIKKSDFNIMRQLIENDKTRIIDHLTDEIKHANLKIAQLQDDLARVGGTETEPPAEEYDPEVEHSTVQ